MNFEFDPKKSASNKKKHGIDFVEAQVLWSDKKALTGEAKVVEDEHRWYRIGLIDEKVFAAIYTMRGEDIRLISVRLAHEKERQAYERKKKNEG